MISTCTKRFSEIPFAHRAPNHSGHCRFVHGHNWTIEATFAADEKDGNGFVLDFGGLGFLKEYLERFDHALVLAKDDPQLGMAQQANSILADLGAAGVAKIVTVDDTSSEGLAEHFFKAFNELILEKDKLSARGVRVVRVAIYEDSKNSATYYETP